MATFFDRLIRAHRIFEESVGAAGVQGQTTRSVVSLSEMGRSSANGPLIPWRGSATMKVYNVIPENGSVRVRGEIDWDSDLDIRITVCVDV